VAIASILSRSKIRELEIRERIARIEKGMVPPPEVDPGTFERDLRGRLDRPMSPTGSGRHRRAGIILMGVGFGLMILIGAASQNPSKGIGIGGFLAILGLAFLINGIFDSRPPTTPTLPARPAYPASTTAPSYPGNPASAAPSVSPAPPSQDPSSGS
jgi:hypothetical protein